MTWQFNGSKSTIDEFRKLDSETKQDVIDFIKEFLIYEEVSVNDKDYLLIHACLGNYSPGKDIDDYSLQELIWLRADYDCGAHYSGGRLAAICLDTGEEYYS